MAGESPLVVEQAVSWKTAVSHSPADFVSFFFDTHINVLGSFRILNFTPWSAKDLDKKVDSAIPWKLFGGDTAPCQYREPMIHPVTEKSYH